MIYIFPLCFNKLIEFKYLIIGRCCPFWGVFVGGEKKRGALITLQCLQTTKGTNNNWITAVFITLRGKSTDYRRCEGSATHFVAGWESFEIYDRPASSPVSEIKIQNTKSNFQIFLNVHQFNLFCHSQISAATKRRNFVFHCEIITKTFPKVGAERSAR